MAYIRVPFADSGDKTPVPVESQSDGSVSFVQGYPLAYSLNPETDAGAKRIERAKMNQLFNDITTAIREMQVTGVKPYITAAENGGTAFSYGLGALVFYNGVVYRSLVAANNQLPSVTANWSPLVTASDNPGRLLNVQVFTASGNYTPTSGTKKIIVEVLGAGGGGGSSSAANTSANGLGTGGGGGGYAKSLLTTVPSSQSITVGQGGAPAGAGGLSSFGSIVANGGSAGGNNLNATYQSGVTQLRGGFGGTASGGNILNARGGMAIQALWTAFGNCLSGAGGSSHFAGTTTPVGGSAGAGDSGTLGNGGSGANSSGNTSVLAGGTGGNGIVIVWEYA